MGGINIILVMGHNSDDCRAEGPELNMIRATPLEENNESQEVGSSAWRGDVRGSGYPVKRFLHAENQKNDSNGFHSDNNTMQSEWRTKSHKGKGDKNDGGGGFSLKGRSLVFSILISVVIACFLIETMLQSSMTVRFGRTEFFPGLTGEVLGRFGERKPLGEMFSFVETVRFVSLKLQKRFMNQTRLDELREEARDPIRPPQLAIVSPDLKMDPSSLMLITIARGLQELGYHLEVYAFKDGPSHSVWEDIGCPVSLLDSDFKKGFTVDWLNFEGVLINSLEAQKAVTSLMQEPFCSIPVIWIIQEDTLARRLGQYALNGWTNIIFEWRRTFRRADVVVFPDYALPMMYSKLDTGNFFVIPGSPIDVWSAERFSAVHGKEEIRIKLGFHKEDFVVVVVGSPFLYNTLWWEHTIAMQAIQPLALKFINQYQRTFRLVFLSNNLKGRYGLALQAIASHLNFPDGAVQHYNLDGDVNSIIMLSDLVLYGSLREEQSFPPILIRAMSFEKPIIAPNLTIIKKHIVDRKHGFIFPAGNVGMMTKILYSAISHGKLSDLACKIASSGRTHAKNLLASDTVLGYAELLEKLLQFPSESMLPKPILSLPDELKNAWQWHLLVELKSQENEQVAEGTLESKEQLTGNSSIVFGMEELWNISIFSTNASENGSVGARDEIPGQIDWDEQKYTEMMEEIERREEEELEERSEKLRSTWEDVYRTARRAERAKFELIERDEGELERTGQPLCVYELYYGPGTWSFLRGGALYRGLSLSAKGRRAGADDMEAADRLPLLNDSYYTDVLCEHGGFLAIANRVDRIHKNPWIGFQSWRATGRKVSLSTEAERVLADAVQSGNNGDTFYFWARMDKDTRSGIAGKQNQHYNDFWSFCDTINAGKCRVVFENAFRQMYNLPSNLTVLPHMPIDGDSWSVLNSWVMSTPSFLEFVMFSRMFVDALDAQHYDKHHGNGTCALGTSKTERKHCYCRLLELLVNVWAYHSARRMIYLDPRTGSMQEQHNLNDRRGQMWVKYFNFTLLKNMDEDLAEEADDDHPDKRWLWPLTGEVHWQGIYEREREERYRMKMEKRRKSKEKLLERLKFGYKQKSLGRYTKPPFNTSGKEESNATDH